MSYATLNELFQQPKTRVVLSLSGGCTGYRMVSHLSLLIALEKLKLTTLLAEIWGVGMGALVGGCFSMFLNTKEVFKLFLKLRKEFWRFKVIHFIGNLVTFTPKIERAGIFQLNMLAELLNKELGTGKTKIPFYGLAFNINKAENQILYSDRTKSICNVILASMSQTGVHTPILLEEHYFLDGSSQEPLPLNSIISKWEKDKERGVTDTKKLLIIAGDTNGFTSFISSTVKPFIELPKNYFEMVNFVNDICFQELIKYDLEKARSKKDVSVIHLRSNTWPHLRFSKFEDMPKALEMAEKIYSLKLSDPFIHFYL